MTTMIRPFREFVERGEGRPAVEIRGEIHEQKLVLHTLGQEIRLPLASSGVDERGSWGIIQEAETPMRDGFRVRVEVEHDEHLPPCTSILIFHERDNADEIRRRHPDAHVVGLIDSALAIRFRPDGSVEASGGSYPSVPTTDVPN